MHLTCKVPQYFRAFLLASNFPNSKPNSYPYAEAWQTVEIGISVEMVTPRIRSDGDERGMLVYGYPRQGTRGGVSSDQ